MDTLMAHMGTLAMARRFRLFWLLAAALPASSAMAASLEVEGDVGVGWTDNLARTSEGGSSEMMQTIGLQFSGVQETRRLNASVNGNLSWMHYSGNTFDSELLGSAAGRLSLDLVEDRLKWTMEDSFGQTRLDLFSVPSPDNRENVNHFSTGPDLQMGLGSANMRLLASGRYSVVDYETGMGDSQTIGGQVGLERLLSSEARLSFNATHERVDPKGAAILPSYDRSGAYVRYALMGARTSLSMDVGSNQVKGGSMKHSGMLLRVELGREAGSRSRFSLSAGQQLTDSGNNLRQQVNVPLPAAGQDTSDLVQSAQPYTSRYLEAGWSISGARTTLDINAGWSEENHVDSSEFDRQRQTLGLRATRRVGVRTELVAGAVFNHSGYSAATGDNDELVTNAALRWSVGPRVRLEVSGEHMRYSSDLPASDSNETRFWLRLRYGDRRNNSSPSP
jgi:hypothetical protein